MRRLIFIHFGNRTVRARGEQTAPRGVASIRSQEILMTRLATAVFAASVLTSPAGSSIAWQSGTGSSSSTDRVTDTVSGPAHACGLRARAGRTLSWSAEDTRHRTTYRRATFGPLLPQDAARCGTDVPICPSCHRRCHALHELAGARPSPGAQDHRHALCAGAHSFAF